MQRSCTRTSGTATTSEKIIAAGFPAERDSRRLGPSFERAYPVSDAKDFVNILNRLDRVEWLPRREVDEK